MLSIDNAFEGPRATPTRSGGASAASAGSSFLVVGAGHPQRGVVEAFIAGVYRDCYGARITQWSPWLVALFWRDRPIAAAGYRRATEPLYLERYLDAPIETMISAAHDGCIVSRGSIVEVGHFASTYPGDGRRLLHPLARHLVALDCRWVAFTATSELQRMFRHLGVAATPLGRADPVRLGASARAWGRYFEHTPLVHAGDLRSNLALSKGGSR